jgi:hypothetical protein
MSVSFRNAARRAAAAASAEDQSTPTTLLPPEEPVLLHRTLGSGLWQQLYQGLPEKAVPPFAVLVNDPERTGVDLALYDTVVRNEVIGNQRALSDPGVQRFILIPLLKRMISAHGEQASLIIMPNGQVWVTDYSTAYNAAISGTLPEAIVKHAGDGARMPKVVRHALTFGSKFTTNRDPVIRWTGVLLWFVLTIAILALVRFYWELTILHMANALGAFEFTSSLSENVRILLSIAMSGVEVVGLVIAMIFPMFGLAVAFVGLLDLLIHMNYGVVHAQEAAVLATEAAAKAGTPEIIAVLGATIPEIVNSFFVTWAPETALFWMVLSWVQLLPLLPWAAAMVRQSMGNVMDSSGVQRVEIDGVMYEEHTVVNPTTGYTSRVVLKRR